MIASFCLLTFINFLQKISQLSDLLLRYGMLLISFISSSGYEDDYFALFLSF